VRPPALRLAGPLPEGVLARLRHGVLWWAPHVRAPAEAPTCRSCGAALTTEPAGRFASHESYTPKHLAECILTSKSALEGERKQVTVLFADLKGSMELLADRDPEQARKILDPVLENAIEAVHRYEGTVNQVMDDGVMALFGAPLAHEDHAVRACYAALRMQESIKRYTEGVFRSHSVLIQIRVGLNSPGAHCSNPGSPCSGRGTGDSSAITGWNYRKRWLKPGEVDAYLYVEDTMVVSQAQLIVDTANAKRIPTIFHERSIVAQGALAGYGVNYRAVGRLSANARCSVWCVETAEHPRPVNLA
jgi:Adenylate and Guanylate cyclase catalytic domain/ABC transporter substrate binding protein